MMPPPRLQIYLCPLVTLNPKVVRFMFLTRGPLVLVGVCFLQSIVFTVFVTDERTDGQTNEKQTNGRTG